MDTTLMNSRTSKTSDPHKILFNISENIDLKRSDQYVALSYLSIYCPQKDIKKITQKISAPTWNNKPGRLYSVSD